MSLTTIYYLFEQLNSVEGDLFLLIQSYKYYVNHKIFMWTFESISVFYIKKNKQIMLIIHSITCPHL